VRKICFVTALKFLSIIFFERCAFKTVNFITDCAITYFPAVLC